jgi:hypothetical protein
VLGHLKMAACRIAAWAPWTFQGALQTSRRTFAVRLWFTSNVWAHEDKRAYPVRRFAYSTIGVRTDFMGRRHDVAFTTGRF